MCASRASRLCECWLPEDRPAPNWVRTVNHYGAIRDVGAGQYASLHTGKYDDNDTFRLEEFDSKLGPQGEFKALTPLKDVPAS